MSERERQALGLLLGVAPRALTRALAWVDDPELLARPLGWWREQGFADDATERLFSPRFEKEFAKQSEALAACGARVLVAGDPEWPVALAQGAPLPPVLFVKGRWPLKATEGVGIVGARRATPYGLDVAHRTARCAASYGRVVISGLAAGIDGAAHQGALEAGGETIGVLGTGLTSIYPPQHAELYAEIAKSGALISQFPPETPPDRGHFPLRNAVIAALSRQVLVVEGEATSGARHTAFEARRYGKTLFAVPGDITRPSSALPNGLLAQGARPLTRPEDLLGTVSDPLPLPLAAKPAKPTKPTKPAARPEPAGLDALSCALWRRLGDGPRDIDELSHGVDATPTELNAALLSLELGGWITQHPGRRYGLV